MVDQGVEAVRASRGIRTVKAIRVVEASNDGDAISASSGAAPEDPPIAKAVFDEAGYTRRNRDVAQAVKDGKFRSGYEHYVSAGFQDGRPMGGRPVEARNRLLPIEIPGLSANDGPGQIAASVDAFFLSRHGLLLVGWVDDVESPIDGIRIVSPYWRVVMDGKSLIRVRRTDVEAQRPGAGGHCYGLIGFVSTEDRPPRVGQCVVEMWLINGAVQTTMIAPKEVEDVRLRDTMLSCVGGALYFGNRSIETARGLEAGAGAALVAVNRLVVAGFVRTPHVERFGPVLGAPCASIVICLYGKPEFLFLQNCLFGGLPGMGEHEFIIVSNSPELAEALLNIARCACLVYGLSLCLVILPDNAGFGAANNAAVRYARSRRLIFINPDVFPKDPSWAVRHRDVVDGGAAEKTRLFGVPLYYDDGALMHAGMYFDIDSGLSMGALEARPCRMVRVEHYGKGAPADTEDLLQSRMVPAVTGAFISCDRDWFDTLGGFTQDYVFGHYEDADLCLKAWQRDAPSWLFDIRMWHLEGKGGVRYMIHEAAAAVNRWLFNTNWMEFIEDGRLGAAPARLAAAPPRLATTQNMRVARKAAMR